MEILSSLSRWRAIGVGVSCFLHAGLIAGVLAAEHWVRAELLKPPVLLAELVTPISDAPPPEPLVKKPVPKPAPRLSSHLPLPKLPFTQPAPPSPAATPPPAPPAPTVAEAPPAPSAPAPSVPAPSSASGIGAATAPPATESAGQPASATSVASAPSGESAAGPITRSARPQGGYQVRPSYPSTALRQGIQGTTLLKVHVLVDGRVGDVLVHQTAGHPDLDQAAIEAVRRWRFEPARRGSDPVAMWVLLPVEFQIR